MTVNVNYVIIVKGYIIIMINYEKQLLKATIVAIKYMQKMKYDKYMIIDNLDNIIEKIYVNSSNEFINCLFDIRQKILFDKEIKKECSYNDKS